MNQEKIGNFIKERRKQKNLTQEELAELLGVNNRSISRWENAKCMPDISLLKDLSKILGVTINDLISGEVVDKNNYQETFEENVVNLVDLKCKRIPLFKILLSSVLIAILLIFIIFSCLYYLGNNYCIDDYNENMYVEKNVNDLNFTLHNENVGEIDAILRKVGDSNIIFIQQKYSIIEKLQFLGDKPTYASTLIPISINELDKIKVYYTTYDLERIKDANLKEIEYIINNSNLLYKE